MARSINYIYNDATVRVVAIDGCHNVIDEIIYDDVTKVSWDTDLDGEYFRIYTKDGSEATFHVAYDFYWEVIRKWGNDMTENEKRLTNSEWIDFLSKQFDISRTSAKEMLHVMMLVKREDNFKRQFSGRKWGRHD